MRESFESSGVWWLPDDPSVHVAGTLRYSLQNGLTLDLLGVLGGGACLGNKTHDVILGSVIRLPEGQSLTLKRCRQNSFTTTSSGLSFESYLAGCAFLGRHLTRPEEFLFSHCTMRTSGLSAWAAHLKGLQTEYGDEGRQGGWLVKVTFTPPPPLRAIVPGGALALDVQFAGTDGLRECSIREDVSIVITMEQPIGEKEWNFRYVYPLLNLVTLVTDTPNALTEFSLSGEGASAGSVKVIERRIFSATEKDAVVTPFRVLVPLRDVAARFPVIVARWLSAAERYKDACNVFFSLRYAPGAYLDVRLDGYSQALGLYAANRPGNNSSGQVGLPPEIMNSLPADAQAALRRWSEGVTIDAFPAVLRQLADEHATILAPLAPNGLAQLVGELLNFSNYARFRKTFPDEPDHYPTGLYLATETLATLMKSCFLAELGFTPEERAAFFQNSATYDFLRTGWADSPNMTDSEPAGP
jgi:hypothetical protein